MYASSLALASFIDPICSSRPSKYLGQYSLVRYIAASYNNLMMSNGGEGRLYK